MIDTGFSALAVSVDAATNETYERIRYGDKLDKFLGNLRMLQSLKAERGVRFPVINFNEVLMESNLDEWPSFVKLGHDLGVAGIAAMHISPFKGIGMASRCMNQDVKRFNRNLDEAREIACELGIKVA